MIFLIAGAVTLLYLLFWPFSVRLDARLSPTCGRTEITLASLVRLRMEGDLLQQPFFSVCRLDRQGRRKPLGKMPATSSGFSPVLRNMRITAALCVGIETDGALTVGSLGLLYALLGELGRRYCEEMVLRPAVCFDKTICALRLSGIARFVLAQNILEYLKGKNRHAKC